MRQVLTSLLLLLSVIGFSQEDEKINTEIKADNIFDLSIIQIYPDAYPKMSVVFQAKNESGRPLWTLDKSEMRITENSNDCEVLNLKNISENKPLNIGVVFDYSSSMNGSTYDLTKAERKVYVSPIEHEKKGVLNFLDGTDLSTDKVLFVGFSSKVDKIYPLTNDFDKMKSFVKGVKASGLTAFFDALYLSIDSLANYSSQGVIVALTDGGDNSSKHSYQEVIDYANAQDISIYIIGLGNVDGTTLNTIAENSNGFYYHTNYPEKLGEIYLNIKDQIRSIYQVDYTSYTEDISKDRNLKFHFVNDTLEFSNSENIYSLPDEAVVYLKEQEEIRLTKLRNNQILIIGGGIGAVLLLGIGSFAVYRRRKKKVLSIQKAFPNPFENEVNIDFQANDVDPTLQLVVTNINGNTVKTSAVNAASNSVQIDLGELGSGTYFVQLSNATQASNSIKIVKK